MDIKIPLANTMRYADTAGSKFNKVDFNRMGHSNLRKSAIYKKVLSLIPV